MGVSAQVQLPASDAQAQRLASAMQRSQPGTPAQSQLPSLHVAVGNAAMMRGAQVEVPPSAEAVLRELEVGKCDFRMCPWLFLKCRITACQRRQFAAAAAA
jgi:hypothetical protein